MTEESVAPLCYLLQAEWQWNSWAGGVVTSMGDCNSAGFLINNRGPLHKPR